MLEYPKDAALIKKARRERWPISEENRLKLEKVVSKGMENSDPEIALRAGKLLLNMDQLNLKEIDIKVKSQPKVVIHTKMTTEELEQRAKELLAELNLTESDTTLLLEAQQSLKKREEECSKNETSPN